jgi:hypothetical protein
METLQAVISFVLGIPWARMLYSAVLIFLIGLFGSELYHLWFDRTLFVGRFEFFDRGAKSEEQGQAFSSRIIQEHRLLIALFQAEYERLRRAEKAQEKTKTDIVPETVQLPVGVAPIRDPQSELANVELSVQGINIKQILMALRKAISMPNEVGGMVNKAEEGVYVSVQWPLGPSMAKVFQIPPQRDSVAGAFHVACSILWAQTLATQTQMALIPRQEFCDWAEAWCLYDLVRSRSLNAPGLQEDDKKLIARARAIVDRLIKAGPTYSEVYRLRADIIGLTPETTPEDKRVAQKDWKQYVKTTTRAHSPAVTMRSIESQLALKSQTERPALIVRHDQLRDNPPEMWAEGLDAAKDRIQQVSRATGRLSALESPISSSGSAFVVGPDLIMTADFVVQPQSTMSIEFDGGVRYPVSEVVFVDDSTHVAILRVAALDEERHPPLALMSNEISTAPENRKIFVVGYAFPDPRVPSAVQAQIFGPEIGVKRVMPGSILRVEPNLIVYDATTTSGTAGSPVVDLDSGKVIAVHWGGRYLDSAKEGYGTPVWTILDVAGVRAVLGL